MNPLVVTILLVFSLVFFSIAAIWNPEPYRVRLIAAGCTAFIASILAGRI